MRKSKFSPQQIAKILKEFDQGKTVEELSREYGMSVSTFYKWRRQYAGMDGSDFILPRFLRPVISFS